MLAYGEYILMEYFVTVVIEVLLSNAENTFLAVWIFHNVGYFESKEFIPRMGTPFRIRRYIICNAGLSPFEV